MAQFLKLLFFALAMALQIYIPCHFGTIFTESATSLSHAIYECHWIDLPLPLQKQVFTYMEYLKIPVIFRAGNFFQIGLGLFLQIINNAYSLYALMVNVKA